MLLLNFGAVHVTPSIENHRIFAHHGENLLLFAYASLGTVKL